MMASRSHVMRPIEEKLVSNCVDLLVWSTKMDLLALSYANGGVALHRLNWLKVWVFHPPQENLTVKGIAWRPDGKVIAIGYSNGDLFLVDVENKETINKTNVGGEISCVLWSEDRDAGRTPSTVNQSEPYQVFLPLLPSLTRGSGEDHANDAKRIADLKNLNMLFVGMTAGKLFIYIFGLFPKVVIDIKTMLEMDECIILDAGVSKDQNVLLVTVLKGREVFIATIDTMLLYSHDLDLMTLAYKYGHIASCLDYMDATLQSIIEGWENIMMEMDSKLRNYASKVPPGRVSCDFLELLMFGTASFEMSEFLLEDLTEKGLKKLNHSVELSYLNIQGLVLRHLQAVGQNLSFQLDEVSGLSRCPSFTEVLGLCEDDAIAGFTATGSFLVKVAEVQNVIDESLKKYKAFFRWLYATILRLCEERVGAEASNMSEIDLQHIVDFLSGFEDNGRFNLEQLGQYLTSSSLEAVPAPAEAWGSLLQRHPSLSELPQIVPHNTKLSLVQEANQLRQQALKGFEKTEKVIEQHFKLKNVTKVQLSPGSPGLIPTVTHSYIVDQQKFMLAMLDPLKSDGYHFIEVWAYEDSNHHSFVKTQQKVVDLQFYLPDVLSLLLDMAPEQKAGFAQMTYPLIGEPGSVRTIEGMIPAKFAVCGTRKVAVVLSDTRRKVKIFEMDVEEEDEEEGMDTTNSSARETDLEMSGRT